MDVVPAAMMPRGGAGPPRAVTLAIGLLCAAVVVAGCGTPSLTHGLESPEAVARAVVRGLATHNLAALRALALTEEEFRDLVWPKLPSSRPGRNIPWDYVWKDLSSKSRLQLHGRVREWEDRRFDLVRIEFTGETTDYQTFRVFRKSVLTLREQDGRETTGRLFGSIIERGGRYKVFSYVVD